MSIKKYLRKIALRTLFGILDQEKLLSVLLRINYGAGCDINIGGEDKSIRYVQNKLKDKYPDNQLALFDVGANIGKYCIALNNAFGTDCLIHAFEPSQLTFNILIENVKSYKSVTCYNIGFSDREAILPVFTNKIGSGITSIYQRRLDHYDIKMDIREDCSFQTIDRFCEKENIDRIHFLKIDVEGHELSVLKGASQMLESGKIDFIQFEFGGCNIDSRTYFQDFWYLLKDRYVFYRIIPTGLYLVKQYSEMREIFMTTNYLLELKG